MSKKHTYEFVKKFFEDNGCLFLEEEYVKASKLVSYQCSCGNKAKVSFSNFQRGRRCLKCKDNRMADKLKHSLEYVKSYFASNGCVLLDEEYKNTDAKLTYRCPKGHESRTSFDNFKKGSRCKKCKRLNK